MYLLWRIKNFKQTNKHTNYLCVSKHQATFDYSNLEAYISKTKNDRNKLISDSES